MTTIAVTGANGFVGRQLIATLIARGYNVVPLSRSRQDDPAWRASPDLDGVDRRGEWSEALRGCAVVIHCAGCAHVTKDSIPDPLAAFLSANRDGSVSLAHGAADAGVSRLVYVSTIKVLGESTTGRRPFSASDLPAPQDSYAISKAEAEAALQSLCMDRAVELAIIRPPLVYGPSAGGNIAALQRWIRRGWPLPLGLAISNRRSMISNANLADALIAAATAPEIGSGALLVSDGQDISTRMFIEGLAAAEGLRPRLFPVPPALLKGGLALVGRRAAWDRLFGDLVLDIGETCRRLSWHPRLPFSEGLVSGPVLKGE